MPRSRQRNSFSPPCIPPCLRNKTQQSAPTGCQHSARIGVSGFGVGARWLRSLSLYFRFVMIRNGWRAYHNAFKSLRSGYLRSGYGLEAVKRAELRTPTYMPLTSHPEALTCSLRVTGYDSGRSLTESACPSQAFFDQVREPSHPLVHQVSWT